MGRASKNFIYWLKKTTGDSQEVMATKLQVSPSLISRYASGERRPTELLIERIAETYSLSPDLVRAQIEQTLHENGWNENAAVNEVNWKIRAMQLETKLLELKDPVEALKYSLAGQLPEKTIEKLSEMIALEIRYAKKTDGGNT